MQSPDFADDEEQAPALKESPKALLPHDPLDLDPTEWRKWMECAGGKPVDYDF
jgi:hypothetical protein